MKKIIASLAVAFLMTAGLVAGTSTTASAGPYSGTITTIPQVQAPVVRPGQRGRIRLEVQSEAGNAPVRGPVLITISKRPSGVARTVKRFYNGNPRNYRLPKLAPGRYTLVVTYVGYPRSVYKPSTQVRNLFVQR
ncbi:hypothetical protein GCM10009737_16550 [Nocardioides lentus]|uniref:Carboxypeptidase regulatory-like domain-containing protein n=1 Tax=Nocardioides lentus TaxID=338077 RepID=A0ABN2P9C5_9ACTN